MPGDPIESTLPDDPDALPKVSNEPTAAYPLPESSETEPPTDMAPPYRPMLGPEPDRDAGEMPRVGQRIEDFDLLRLLGKGSFGVVFLARQVSLDRQVVVKVTANAGHEAQTLASLEHDHIVRVFSETVLAEQNLRLMCMQYVPGTTLDNVIDSLGRRPRREWTGKAILEAIDRLSIEPGVFHPAALRDRQFLAEADLSQAVCRIGAQLAEAIDYAHSQGVLHRDIKPANVLMNQYGRPLLADFNLAFRARTGGGTIGGTLVYMAPEHLDAFNPDGHTPPEAVDRRSDVYSLGVVLFELATGRRPFGTEPASSSNVYESLKLMTAERRNQAPSARQLHADVPELLDRVLRRCLEPVPERRYQSGVELARALESCRELRRREEELPTAGPLTRAVQRRPFLGLVILCLLPHIVGSAVNISYNVLEVIGDLNPAQQQAFDRLVLGYNAIVYPASLAVVCWLFLPVFRVWRVLKAGGTVAADRVDRARRGVLAWPAWIVFLSCIGWLPGGLLFPLGIQLQAGPLDSHTFGHFLVSFTISGLIALTYSYFAAQYVVLRVLYPRLWVDVQDLRHTTVEELQSPGPRLRLFQLLAGMIPLAGAVLMIGVSSEVSGELGFRVLVTTLIFLGMAGFGLAIMTHNYLSRTLAALIGAKGN